MKFAHLADLHIGAWRERAMSDLSLRAFNEAIDRCLRERVDFIIFAGDLFNTALPGIDPLKEVTAKLRGCAEAKIPIYCIPGSHDYSPSGKTMLDVLEEARLLTNLVRGEVVDSKLRLTFTRDPKTGVKLAGMIGKRGALERHYYDDIDREALEREQGPKIFCFHSAITELKPKSLEQMDSAPISMLPRGFDYYAGGHVHIVRESSLPGYATIVYPGPLYPANFRELEELGGGGFVIVEDFKVRRIGIAPKPVRAVTIDLDNTTPSVASERIRARIDDEELDDAIVLVRLEGRLVEGSVADIPFSQLYERWRQAGAYHIAKNTVKLSAEGFEEIGVRTTSVEEIEEAVLREHVGQVRMEGVSRDEELALARDLLCALSEEQHEGEKKYEFDARIRKEGLKLLRIAQSR